MGIQKKIDKFNKELEEKYKQKYDFVAITGKAEVAFGQVHPAFIHYSNKGDGFINQDIVKPPFNIDGV